MSTNRRDKFYHSSVEVQDLGFEPIDVSMYTQEQRNNFYKVLKEFSSKETSLTRKREIADTLPDNWFCHCRFCGKKIVNKNSTYVMNRERTVVKAICPVVKYRVIDGVKYELSCCEDCLLEHFKDNPPKSSKYYFMKVNIYGMYSFGYSEDEYKKITSSTVGITLENLTRKWGPEEGKRRWDEYRDKQARTNTFEYKQEKYGWNKEEFKKYNKSRSCTLENFIKRHGDEEGRRKWDEYCKRQSYTTSLDYMIKEYGEEEGKRKWANYNDKRLIYQFKSEISEELFMNVYNKLRNLGYDHEIYFLDLNYEYEVYGFEDSVLSKLDFYDKTINYVIEFNGDFWHANPNRYKADDIIKISNKSFKASDIWERDKIRKESVIKELGCIFDVVWETDYCAKMRKEDKEVIEDKIVNKIIAIHNLKFNGI